MNVEYTSERGREMQIKFLQWGDENNYIVNELLNTFLGKEIGSGSSRFVFEHPFDKTKVIKIARNNKLENAYEYRIWNTAPKYVKKWLAPVHFISRSGIVMIQERAEPLPNEYKMPNRLPSFLNSDLKPHNFGLIDGKLVCIDYACALISFNNKMVNVKWWPNA